MKNDNFKTNEITFPEESGVIIEKILEKYGLKETDEQAMNKFFKAKTEEERARILREAPGAKISLLLREYQKGRVKLEHFPAILKLNLKISTKEAEEITEELKEKILFLPRPKKIETPEKPFEEKSPPLKKPDIYREPIE